MNAEELQELKEAFDRFDNHKRGKITYDQFENGLKDLGLELSKAEVRELLRETDTNRDGTVDFNEFVTMMKRASEALDGK